MPHAMQKMQEGKNNKGPETGDYLFAACGLHVTQLWGPCCEAAAAADTRSEVQFAAGLGLQREDYTRQMH